MDSTAITRNGSLGVIFHRESNSDVIRAVGPLLLCELEDTLTVRPDLGSGLKIIVRPDLA